jgi:hypothetical protein
MDGNQQGNSPSEVKAPPKAMAWIITRDFLFRKADKEDRSSVGWGENVEGRTSFRDKKLLKEIVATMPTQFRLMCGDGKVIVHGYMKDIEALETVDAFAPQDWATPRFGAAELQYRPAGSGAKWSVL